MIVTIEEARNEMGRIPFTIVELELDSCANVYGSAPCTAAVGVTGTQKCFNCFKTCQDQANFVKTTKTYKFCTNTSFLPIGENLFPCIEGIDVSPTQVDPKGLAVNASATVTLGDFAHHDRGVDPYVAERDYDPEEQGTFFGKLRARNPFLVNRKMRIKEGYITGDREVVTSNRTYFFDRMEGPTNGVVKLVGKGLIKFADDDKAQVPTLSRGKLATGIDDNDMSFTLEPAGIGVEYVASGKIRIDDEIISYSSIAGDVFTLSARGENDTIAAVHDADALAQQCVEYSVATPADVIYDWLVNNANVPAGYITKADWDNECTTWIPAFVSSVLLTQPTGVREMLEEILQSCGAALWWDEIDEQLRFKVMVPYQILGDIPVLNEDQHFLENSLSVRDLEKERLSRVVVRYGSTNVLKKPDAADCPNAVIVVDVLNESENAYGVPVTLEIISRWVPSSIVGEEMGSRMIARYGQTPRELTFTLDAKDSSLKAGGLTDAITRQVQDLYGASASIRYIVTEERETEPGSHHQFKALQISQQGGGKAYLITGAAQADWTAATDEEKGKYFFLSDEAGLMSDGEIGARLV